MKEFSKKLGVYILSGSLLSQVAGFAICKPLYAIGVSSSSVSAPVARGGRSLNVPVLRQQNNWCWVTSSQMMIIGFLRENGHNINSGDIYLRYGQSCVDEMNRMLLGSLDNEIRELRVEREQIQRNENMTREQKNESLQNNLANIARQEQLRREMVPEITREYAQGIRRGNAPINIQESELGRYPINKHAKSREDFEGLYQQAVNNQRIINGINNENINKETAFLVYLSTGSCVPGQQQGISQINSVLDCILRVFGFNNKKVYAISGEAGMTFVRKRYDVDHIGVVKKQVGTEDKWGNGVIKSAIDNNSPLLAYRGNGEGLNRGHYTLIKGYHGNLDSFDVIDPMGGDNITPNVRFNMLYYIGDKEQVVENDRINKNTVVWHIDKSNNSCKFAAVPRNNISLAHNRLVFANATGDRSVNLQKLTSGNGNGQERNMRDPVLLPVIYLTDYLMLF